MTPAFLDDASAFLDERFPLPLDRPFTTRQAHAAGVTRRALAALLAAGLVRRVVKGVYVAIQVPDSRDLRSQALGLVVPPGSVVTDWTAAWFWTGIDHPGARDMVPPLSVFRFRGHARLRNSLVQGGERWLRPSDCVPLDGNILITTELRTAWDLGRLAPRILAIGGMDALARTGAFTVAELMDDVARFRRQRGVVQLRQLAPLVDGRSESFGESALRLRWVEVPGLPPPELQIPVLGPTGRVVYRLDLGVEELGLGVEYDGEEWHSSPEDRAHDGQRRRLLEDRYGWVTEVFRREHVFGQRETASTRIPAAVREARRTVAARRAAVHI
jgi:hypothetical protein